MNLGPCPDVYAAGDRRQNAAKSGVETAESTGPRGRDLLSTFFVPRQYILPVPVYQGGTPLHCIAYT